MIRNTKRYLLFSSIHLTQHTKISSSNTSLQITNTTMPRELLNRTLIFSSFTDPFKDEIAKIMSPIEAPAGHVFIKEGEEITKFMIVESGSLVRTKASAGEGEPLVLDTISENGVTGFMHVAARNSGIAYATVSAGEEGAKVWVVGVEFDQVLRYVYYLQFS